MRSLKRANLFLNTPNHCPIILNYTKTCILGVTSQGPLANQTVLKPRKCCVFVSVGQNEVNVF